MSGKPQGKARNARRTARVAMRYREIRIAASFRFRMEPWLHVARTRGIRKSRLSVVCQSLLLRPRCALWLTLAVRLPFAPELLTWSFLRRNAVDSTSYSEMTARDIAGGVR